MTIGSKVDALGSNGALSSILLKEMASAGFIKGFKDGNIRPASLDLSISDEIYKVEGIFQPKKSETVRQVLGSIKKTKHSLEKPLTRQAMYVVRLNETLNLPKTVYGFCNPKSTSGRLDTHVRLIADGVSRYDFLPPGWAGELWISIVAKSFPIKLHAGMALNQLRFFVGAAALSDLELEINVKKHKLLWRAGGDPYDYADIRVRDNDATVILTLDLPKKNLGYESISSNNLIDLARVGFYSPNRFFKPIRLKGDYVYLKKDAFYILSTHEYVRVPPQLACEMVPMDERSGEFRSHYAGFIDPGWGWGANGEGKGRPLTLEVRPFEDLIVRQGQPIAKIKFEKVIQPPEIAYDAAGSNYIFQSGPRLAKHFKT